MYSKLDKVTSFETFIIINTKLCQSFAMSNIIHNNTHPKFLLQTCRLRKHLPRLQWFDVPHQVGRHQRHSRLLHYPALFQVDVYWVPRCVPDLSP